jgi:hypothetical protein
VAGGPSARLSYYIQKTYLWGCRSLLLKSYMLYGAKSHTRRRLRRLRTSARLTSQITTTTTICPRGRRCNVADAMIQKAYCAVIEWWPPCYRALPSHGCIHLSGGVLHTYYMYPQSWVRHREYSKGPKGPHTHVVAGWRQVVVVYGSYDVRHS